MVKRIAYLGPVGTYTEEAALSYDPHADLQPFPTIAAVGLAVSSGVTDEGVVPIENSLEGSVTYTLDLLISQSHLSIYKEIVLPIEHYLMARPGTRAPDVQVIYSHPQALAQCRIFLERCFPQAQQTASLSTVAAVTDMQASDVPAAAIAPQRAAELHQVEIIGQNIQDNPNNVTRFVVLSPQDHPPTGKDKTSICFSFTQDAPGVLYQALGEFARRNINLAKIESRPTKESLGQYIFLIDCHGHREDPLIKEALDALGRRVSVLKVLGSYPSWQT
ncbi:MAG TPA: prephenate dehydratase [Dehalococcoidia bacterium]|nr:prephenate dehydratase [Dehalococcoidia bacterium]